MKNEKWEQGSPQGGTPLRPLRPLREIHRLGKAK
jgi:hypothetical protein